MPNLLLYHCYFINIFSPFVAAIPTNNDDKDETYNDWNDYCKYNKFYVKFCASSRRDEDCFILRR